MKQTKNDPSAAYDDFKLKIDGEIMHHMITINLFLTNGMRAVRSLIREHLNWFIRMIINFPMRISPFSLFFSSFFRTSTFLKRLELAGGDVN